METLQQLVVFHAVDEMGLQIKHKQCAIKLKLNGVEIPLKHMP